ncbi:MAG TPA: transglycosylase domain-containing protein [Xanthobacteraceae bacterium]|nr:transglycosylase domain-containing protein [Xanthobacteraceae bacterium]
MNLILVKLFATALALSQVTTRPDDVRTRFDPEADRAVVSQILSDGCGHMKRMFDIESINLDDLIDTAMADPDALTGEIEHVKGLSIPDLHVAYRQFCKREQVANSPIDLGQVITFYNNAVADLPGDDAMRAIRLPGATLIQDGKGKTFAELFEPNNRRQSISISEVPKPVRDAFVAAEDKRFYEHKGIDERGVIRAFMGLLTSPGRPPGGSTITQQVVKNLLVGNDVTYERKIRELILAPRLERVLSKEKILELYLNSIYFGRGAWGIELAAQGFFGKPAKDLSLNEGAFLAGLVKGPGYYNPDRFPDRARQRFAYVLERMVEDKFAPVEAAGAGKALPAIVAYERNRRDTAFHFVDFAGRQARSLAKLESLTDQSYVVRTTLNQSLQRAAELALQEGLARYEANTGRADFKGPEANLSEAIAKIETAAKKAADSKSAAAAADAGEADDAPASAMLPAWQQALQRAQMPLYDVHWSPAIVLEKAITKNASRITVGLRDGRRMPLTVRRADHARKLSQHDVVLVHVVDGDGKKRAARAELRVRPEVQGGALVLENKTGRILAMTGAFSYPLSQLNRVTQSQRQPGSALKPLVYLAALSNDMQPTTLVEDLPVTFPPPGGAVNAQAKDYWSPKNYDGSMSGVITLRQALEHSKNLATARLLDGGVSFSPDDSLNKLCAMAVEAQIYKTCEKYYPFVLGAQPVRMVDLAAFYAAIATEGERPTPYVIESIAQEGRETYRHADTTRPALRDVDKASYFQVKSMMQGVVARGTAARIAALSPFVAGKTGTSADENDAWFVGFTNDVTIAVWVGYDNADGKRRTLGRGATGGTVAIPIFQDIVQAAWAYHKPRARLNGPSPEAQKMLVAMPIDPRSGAQLHAGTPGAFIEYLKTDSSGRVAQHDRLYSREASYPAYGAPDDDGYYDEIAPQYQQPQAREPQQSYQWEYGVGVQPSGPPPQQQQRQAEPELLDRYGRPIMRRGYTSPPPVYQRVQPYSQSRAYPQAPAYGERYDARGRVYRAEPDTFWSNRSYPPYYR